MLREKRRNDMYVWGERCRKEERRRFIQASRDLNLGRNVFPDSNISQRSVRII